MAKDRHWAWSCKSGIELPPSADNALMFDVQTGSNQIALEMMDIQPVFKFIDNDVMLIPYSLMSR